MVGLINNWLQAAQDSPAAHAGDALDALKTAVEPSRKTELWRYSDVARLQQLPQSAANNQPLPEADWVLVITADGVTGADALPDGIVMKTIHQVDDLLALERHADLSHVVNITKPLMPMAFKSW